MQLEDGEIPSDESLDYVPLTRPQQPGCPSAEVVRYTSSDDTSSDDSDHLRLPKVRKFTAPTDKYNVWVMNQYQEDLALSMTRCGMDSDKARAVESYPYKLASSSRLYNCIPAFQRNNCKVKTNEERCDENISDDENQPLMKRCFKKRRRRVVPDLRAGDPLKLDELAVTKQDTVDQIACDIADKLNETNMEIIKRSVSVLGKSKAIGFYEQTKLVEQEGGMLIYDRTRKRTSGGVFLHLIRTDNNVTPHQMRMIFDDLRGSLPHYDSRVKKNLTKRKKAGQKDDMKITEIEPDAQELENPPPSPATDCDPVQNIQKGSNIHLRHAIDFLESNI